MFGRREEEEGTVIGGITLVITESGGDVTVKARCRKTEIKYLLEIIVDRLKGYEEEPAGPARPRLRRYGR